MWDQLEPTTPHVAYLTFSSFLLVYALFSQFIKDNLHISEPPLAVTFGILLGPYAFDLITPDRWGMDDGMVQELTRVIVGIQCFAVGIELPKHYFWRHWKSVLYFLGPVMFCSWVITSLFAYLIFKTGVATALIIGACLSPTDPVLAASVLAQSRFSKRVPKRLKHLLAAESACNDGVSFPFLYTGIMVLKFASAGKVIEQWFLITILWQCAFGLILGLIIGNCANKLLRFSDSRKYISQPAFVVFYLLLAILCVGVGSILGSDDFLIAFGAGVGFAHDGWFSKKTESLPFPTILDMVLNSSMFVFFGTIIPFRDFKPRDVTPNCGIWQLCLFVILVLLFRRIPIVIAIHRFIPDVRTFREALFCGHFGPMGVGALFLAMEARAELETGTGVPHKKPGKGTFPLTGREEAVFLVWPVICATVLGSTMVHGLSTLGISVYGHFLTPKEERAPLLGQQTDGLDAMVHEGGGGESEPEISGSDDDHDV
ncbi:Na(+)/H(+) antiporter [Lachnellula hyalina]|uniref:Na(+)/H(+) antiporter n=1 Tax=Lachnellula hyalina TaxID=1316788 RepID=A0A8H8R631_9HELO|nr:Na(+)/H(+) antiporter [Lachnellula hyalina]TVY28296.1 Na(+)/H(+) antiporter [Lachnellula hyalina]